MTCSDNVLDSMRFFRSYLKENPNRIYLPNDDYTYFDPLFYQLEQAQKQGKTYRVMHYGDSQIEMDRITSVLRQRMQEMFGEATTPVIAEGRVPLVLELLSPAQRPLQITRDLSAFWQGSYREVQKEMKGRYPKHVWPDDPANTAPTRRSKKYS